MYGMLNQLQEFVVEIVSHILLSKKFRFIESKTAQIHIVAISKFILELVTLIPFLVAINATDLPKEALQAFANAIVMIISTAVYKLLYEQILEIKERERVKVFKIRSNPESQQRLKLSRRNPIQ